MMATAETNITQIRLSFWTPSFHWKQHSASQYTNSWSVRTISSLIEAVSPQKGVDPKSESYNMLNTRFASTRKQEDEVGSQLEMGSGVAVRARGTVRDSTAT